METAQIAGGRPLLSRQPLKGIAFTVFSAVVEPLHGSPVPQERHGKIEEHARRPSISTIAVAPCGSSSALNCLLEATAAQIRRGATNPFVLYSSIPGIATRSETSVSNKRSQRIASI